MKVKNKNEKNEIMKMKIEIWSDIVCPFCYLGKHKFENALAQFNGKEYIEVEWKSFQLNPDLVTDTTISIHQYLAEIKGFSMEQARQMNDRFTLSGKPFGLVYNFNKVVVANSYCAQNLVHFALLQGKQNEMEERLFEAYFTEGKNIDDIPTLILLATETGLNVEGLDKILLNKTYAGDVEKDIVEARSLNIHGVPFFVFNRKYAVSGAQETPVFLDTLKKSFDDWRKDYPEVKDPVKTYSFKP
jgi:predicted DsbA family dithiol-disulfide isomerase